MDNKKICALCKEEKPLHKSHIIPKFVTSWIKDTSITKGLRVATKKNKRVEDGIKEELLCKECEERFSKLETFFANNVFHPSLKGQEVFECDKLFDKFVSSLSWRILVTEMETYLSESPELEEVLLDIEEKLRGYLLDQTEENPCKNYFFFFDESKLNYNKVDKKFHWYIQRSTDGTLAVSKEVLFIYSKFPKMFFITQIKPDEFLAGGKILFNDGDGNFAVDPMNNLILEGDKIEKCPLVFYPSFENFLLDRVKKSNLDGISKEQSKRIEELIMQNKDRILGSESFKTHLLSSGERDL